MAICVLLNAKNLRLGLTGTTGYKGLVFPVPACFIESALRVVILTQILQENVSFKNVFMHSKRATELLTIQALIRAIV